MLNVYFSKQFKKDYKKVARSKINLAKLQVVIAVLAQNKDLDKKYHSHQLKGKYNHYQECHITPDLLLIYRINNDTLVLYLLRLGSHSVLFE